VTWGRLQGGVCAYLLLGMAWASLFQLVEQLHPGSFQANTAHYDPGYNLWFTAEQAIEAKIADEIAKFDSATGESNLQLVKLLANLEATMTDLTWPIITFAILCALVWRKHREKQGKKVLWYTDLLVARGLAIITPKSRTYRASGCHSCLQ
jgi:hypothetical protein